MYKGVTIITALLFLAMILPGCEQMDRKQQMIGDLLKVDREFSRTSIELGAPESFLQYIDDSCALLRPNRYPVIGREKIAAMFSKPDTSMVLSWEPLHADVSASNDLGYTYGIYTIQMDSPEGKVVTKEGTYVTIWKKNKKGEWKFVLDTGNQGLGPQNGEKK